MYLIVVWNKLEGRCDRGCVYCLAQLFAQRSFNALSLFLFFVCEAQYVFKYNYGVSVCC
jgi:hypothetical protein